MTVENLDTNQILTDDNGKATPYLEDYLFQIVNALGGEGSTDVITTIEQTIEDGVAGRLKSSIASLKNRINDLENTIESTPGNSLFSLKKRVSDIENTAEPSSNNRLLSLDKRVDDLEKTAEQTPVNSLLSIRRELEAIESQINTPINLKRILDRLNAIEAQL